MQHAWHWPMLLIAPGPRHCAVRLGTTVAVACITSLSFTIMHCRSVQAILHSTVHCSIAVLHQSRANTKFTLLLVKPACPSFMISVVCWLSQDELGGILCAL